MSPSWCRVCGTRHLPIAHCPGQLRATGPERASVRLNVETDHGAECYGVLVAPSTDLWRARIMTYPRTLWTVPGGGGSIKFVGNTPEEVERRAIEFIRTHCERRGYLMRGGSVEVELPAGGEVGNRHALAPPKGPPAKRKARFVWVRFGVDGPTESAKTGNLSETGLFVITDSPAREGQWLEVMLEIEDEPIELRGEVRWKRTTHDAGRAPGMGIQLQAPPPAYLEYVRALD